MTPVQSENHDQNQIVADQQLHLKGGGVNTTALGRRLHNTAVMNCVMLMRKSDSADHLNVLSWALQGEARVATQG